MTIPFRALSGIAAALAITSGAAADAQRPEAQFATLYRHATVVDVEAGSGRPDTDVLVRGERIEAVLPDREASRLTEFGRFTVVDLSGRYLVPGLIDSHEHLATPPNAAQAKANMRRDLYGGVTAARVMADDLRSIAELAREARQAEIPGPDLYYAALMAGPSFFNDPRTHAASRGLVPGSAPWMQAIAPETDLAAAVAVARGTGATAIKVYANLDGAEVIRIAAEAHRQGLPVWAHGAVFPASPTDVIAAGADVMSHSCYLAYQVVGVPRAYQERVPVDPSPFVDGSNAVLAGLFTRMRAQGVILDATGRVYVEGDAAFAAGKGRRPYCTADLAAVITRQAWKAGVSVSAGTDGLAGWKDPWPALYDELEFLNKKVGLSTAETLRAATVVSARAANQTADMGSIAPGKLANFVVLAADPLEDIANVRSIVMTVKRGRAYPRADYRPITEDEFKDVP